MADEDAYPAAGDVLIAQGANLAYAQARGIHEGHHGFLLEARHGGDEVPCLLLGGDIGEVFVEPAHRQLCVVPWLMEDIEGEEAQLGDGAIDRAVREGTLPLEPADEGAHLLPGHVLWELVEDVLQVVQIGTDVGRVAFEGMAGKAAQGDHLPIRFKIFVHNGTSLVWDVEIAGA